MNRTGKCVNYASCLLAYRAEEVTVTEGDFVCPECGQPLLPASALKGVNFKKLAISGVVILCIALGSLLVLSAVLGRYQRAADAGEQRAAATVAATPVATPTAIPTASAEPALESVPAAATVTADANPDLNLANTETQQVKTQVLQRIDLMPNVSEDNKDKLYMSVERARQMGRLLVVPFASGRSEMIAPDIAKLREELKTPGVKKLLDDPTAVFVILGFADTSGDPAANLKISETRARNVLNILHDQCGVVNVMHAVGMGGSQLFDASGKEKNRVAEIWTVLP